MDALDPQSAHNLDEAADHFAQTALQCRLRVVFGPTAGLEISRISEEITIGPELAHWYGTHAPLHDFEIPQLGNFCTVYAPSRLVENQAGYRWSGRTSEGGWKRVSDWPEEWIVIADIGADPVIADAGRRGTPISTAMIGAGEWYPEEIAPTLADYLEAHARWMDICLIQTGAYNIQNWQEANKKVWDADGHLLSDVADALRRSLEEILAPTHLANWLQ
ncbi:MAG TPA: hypothetical protein VGR57_21830 [Ktedonobacterales bacterium]|nr:hypothetical protein [Ktedonobacterales bacterium]